MMTRSHPIARTAPTLALATVLAVAAGGRFAATPAAATSPAVPAAAHDLHIAYADLAIEGSVIAGRIRIFKDDLERALGPLVGADAFTLRPGPESDALVLRYLRDHLTLRMDGTVLEPVLLSSGQDELDREPVWWVLVQYPSDRPVGELRVRNTLLFDVFDDQRNIMKFVRFPEESQKTFYFAEGEEEAVVGV